MGQRKKSMSCKILILTTCISLWALIGFFTFPTYFFIQPEPPLWPETVGEENNVQTKISPIEQEDEPIELPKLEEEKPENKLDISSYFNADVKKNGCSVTIVFVDPRISKAPKGADVWHSLESMAANVVPIETTCVSIQTSFQCPFVRGEDLYARMKENALPLFGKMIDNGNVRVIDINTRKYSVGHCNWNVNRLFMHPKYWSDEFTEEDSDMAIVLQPDSVFCREFNASLWNGVAYAGGVWPPRPWLHNNPAPPQGVCNAIKEFWKRFNPSHTDNLDMCSDGLAPHGNGGFSLRSRHWMIKATNTCPSRFVTTPIQSCYVVHDYPEDLYFATVLPGLNAPIANGVEAALFGVEMIFLEKVLEYYPRTDNITDFAVKRLGLEGATKFLKMRKEGRTIPIGLHKPWWYHDNGVLFGAQMKRECPYLESILPSSLKQKYYNSQGENPFNANQRKRDQLQRRMRPRVLLR